jgi:DNA-binding response OmpR family regulator
VPARPGMTVAPSPGRTDGTARWTSEELRETVRLTCLRSRALIAKSREALSRHSEAVAMLRSAVPVERGAAAREDPADGHPPALALDGEVVVGELRLMPLRTAVVGAARLVSLTPAEWQLLVTLVRHRTTTLSRTEIATRAWGPGFAGRHSQVEVYISRLRRKLARAGPCATILTVRRQGYRLRIDGDREVPAELPPGGEDPATR